MVKDDYISVNDWYITASKLKTYARNPEEYKLQYVDKIELEQEKKRHFILGTAIDDLLTYRINFGSNEKYSFESNPVFWLVTDLQIKLRVNDSVDEDQSWIRRRLKKYYIDEWLVVDELKSELLKLPIDQRYWYTDTAIRSLKLNQLRSLYYERGMQDRIRLTPWEAKTVLGMYQEVMRQPNMDIFNRWGTQVCIETKYHGAKIRWTLDRFVVVDKDGNRYLPSEIDEYIKVEGTEARLKLVADLGMYGVIRDRKSTGSMDRFEYDMEETFDYVLSMSFYFVLVMAKYNIRSEVYLDVLDKKEPHWSMIYRLKPNRIVDKVKNYIKPLIDDLIRAHTHNVRDPIKPLSGEPVSRYEMMKSPYYSYMQWSLQDKIIEPWN